MKDVYVTRNGLSTRTYLNAYVVDKGDKFEVHYGSGDIAVHSKENGYGYFSH